MHHKNPVTRNIWSSKDKEMKDNKEIKAFVCPKWWNMDTLTLESCHCVQRQQMLISEALIL